MNKISTELSSQKTGIVFLSGSAGELDWMLPIIDDLLKKDFNFKIIFLTRHARLSVKSNQLLNDYIESNHRVEIFYAEDISLKKWNTLLISFIEHQLNLSLVKSLFFKLFIVF